MNWLPPSIKWNPTNKLFGQFRLKSEHRGAKAAIPTPGSRAQPALCRVPDYAECCRIGLSPVGGTWVRGSAPI